MTCLEPACGAGHMAKVLKEYFREIRCADAYHYDYGVVRDFLTTRYERNSADWVIALRHFFLVASTIALAILLEKVVNLVPGLLLGHGTEQSPIFCIGGVGLRASV
jgi:hypothetical protein